MKRLCLPVALFALLPLACGDSGSGEDENFGSFDGTAEGTGNNDEVGTETGTTGDTGTSTDTTSTSTDTGTTGDTGTTSDTGTTGDTGTDTTDTGGTDTTTTDTDTTTTTTTTTGEPDCLLQLEHVPCDDQDDDPFHAIGLDCDGDEPAVIPLNNSGFMAMDNASWKVANQFGSSGDWQAREGEKLLIVSTGELTDPDQNGVVLIPSKSTQPGTDNNNQDGVNNLPNPISPLDGSGGVPFEMCDGVNDCSDTLQAQWELGGETANDLLHFDFELTPPAEANGFEFDFAFFSAEFPEWVDTEFNDIFVVWMVSEAYTGNVTFIEDQPLTVTALQNYIVFQGNNGALDGTGFDGVGMGPGQQGPIGGATGWFAASGTATPDAEFSLTWAIFDMGDSIYDTTVIIDDFRWSCEGCIPSEIDGCGLIPQ